MPMSSKREMPPTESLVVERAENEMAGERAADGNLGGLEVAHFTDHDDVRVAAQDTAQPGGEGEIDLGFDGDLDDAVELVFDRVLDGDDAAVPSCSARGGKCKSVLDFPQPVGPVTRMMPLGSASSARMRASRAASMPRPLRSRRSRPSRRRLTLSPFTEGMVATRTS